MSVKRNAKTAARKPAPAKKKRRPSRGASRATWAVASNARRGAKERIAALERLSGAVCDNRENLQRVLSILRDTATPIAVRLAALRILQAASFSVLTFNAYRVDYLAALRSVVADPDPELRQRVLGILSREQDGYAQRMLLKGLQDPAQALVPPEKALQLLSYDIHADAYPVARALARKPPNPAAKREALRLLAADATSAPIFEKILRNKDEPFEIRQLAASALHSLAPKKLQARARAIVLDKTESDPIRATSLTALTHFGDDAAVARDSALFKHVDRLKVGAGSAGLKRVARSFLTKYRR